MIDIFNCDNLWIGAINNTVQLGAQYDLEPSDVRPWTLWRDINTRHSAQRLWHDQQTFNTQYAYIFDQPFWMTSSWWLSAKLQYLQHVSNGDTTVLYKALNLIICININHTKSLLSRNTGKEKNDVTVSTVSANGLALSDVLTHWFLMQLELRWYQIYLWLLPVLYECLWHISMAPRKPL